MRRIEVLIIFFLSCYFLCIAGQVSYSTKKLEMISNYLGLKYLDTISLNSENRDAYFYNDRELHIKKNRWGEISHIGYSIFSEEEVRLSKSPVYLFLERYLLELDLPSDMIPEKKLEVDKVIVNGDLEKIFQKDENYAFTIHKRAMRMYFVEWKFQDKTSVNISFKMDAQLILGCNAVELDFNMKRDLCRSSKEFTPIEFSESELYSNGNIYVLYGDTSYLDRRVKRDIYYQRKGNNFVLLNDPKFVSQSISNIFLAAGEHSGDYILDITMDRYAYSVDKFQLKLGQWISYCQNEGCICYLGIKKKTSDKVYATIYAVNSNLGYNHVMSVECPISVLEDNNVEVSARLYGYIPLNDVSEDMFNFDFL